MRVRIDELFKRIESEKEIACLFNKQAVAQKHWKFSEDIGLTYKDQRQRNRCGENSHRNNVRNWGIASMSRSRFTGGL